MVFERITSQKNPTVQTLKSLRERKGREATGLFLVEGAKMIAEALGCGLTPALCLYGEAAGGVPAATLDRLYAAGAEIHPVPESLLAAACDTKTPQGCCCAFAAPRPIPPERLPDRIVALDGVQDPGNVGTIWRTADAAGFRAIVLTDDCADPLSPKVQRAAMGSGFRVPFMQTDDLAALLAGLKARGCAVVVSHLRGEPFYAHPPLGDKIVLVVGSEARGASERVTDEATVKLKLPMRGGAESLNAAVAAGIMMYELTKGRLPD